MGMQIRFFVKDQSAGCYFEKVQVRFFDEEKIIDHVYPKENFGAVLDEALLAILRNVFDTLEKVGDTEDYFQFLDFKIKNVYNSAFVSKHFLLYQHTEVEDLMSHVLNEVADLLAEGYFESMIDYLETTIDDEVFVDFRLNGDELLLEAQSQGRKVNLVEPLKQLIIDYDESFERVAQEILENFA